MLVGCWSPSKGAADLGSEEKPRFPIGLDDRGELSEGIMMMVCVLSSPLSMREWVGALWVLFDECLWSVSLMRTLREIAVFLGLPFLLLCVIVSVFVGAVLW